ncbi:MAG: hypothetical protein GX903_09345 [Spirochaetales bacterium]|nr:hypothetical protein [Spirochaetales bacterium]
MAQSVLELKQTVDNKLVNGLGTTNSPSNNDVERQTAIKLAISYLIKGLLGIYEQEGEVSEEDINKISECIASL